MNQELTKEQLNHRREVLFNIMNKKLQDSINKKKEELSKDPKVDPMSIEDDFSFTVIKDK